MDENKEEEDEEERSTGGDGESDMMEEKEPQLESLGAPNLDGKARRFLVMSCPMSLSYCCVYGV